MTVSSACTPQRIDASRRVRQRIAAGKLLTENDIAPYHVPAGTGDGDFLGLFQLLDRYLEAVNLELAGLEPLAVVTLTVDGHLLKGGQFSDNSSPLGVRIFLALVVTMLTFLSFSHETVTMAALRNVPTKMAS